LSIANYFTVMTMLIRDVRIMRQKTANSVCVICKFRAPFLRMLCKFWAKFQPVFSMIQLSVTPVYYYPEYRGLLVHVT